MELKRGGGDFPGEYLRLDRRYWSRKVELFEVGNDSSLLLFFGIKVGSLVLPLLGNASKTCNFLGLSRFGFAFGFFFVTVTLIGGRNPTVASYMSKGRFFLSRSLFLFNFFFLNHSLIMAQEYLLRLLTRRKGIIICC